MNNYFFRQEMKKLCTNFGKKMEEEQMNFVWNLVKFMPENEFKCRLNKIMTEEDSFPRNLKKAFNFKKKTSLTCKIQGCYLPGSFSIDHAQTWLCSWHDAVNQGKVEDNVKAFEKWRDERINFYNYGVNYHNPEQFHHPDERCQYCQTRNFYIRVFRWERTGQGR